MVWERISGCQSQLTFLYSNLHLRKLKSPQNIIYSDLVEAEKVRICGRGDRSKEERVRQGKVVHLTVDIREKRK